MRNIILLSVVLFCFSCNIETNNKPQKTQKPKLVVGIIVDQMRQEYLYRFQNKYGEDGFKKMIGEGYMLKNVHFNYVPTYTGPGHTSVYTGSTPAVHGIIANEWYSKTLGKDIYCAYDSGESSVGSDSKKGKMSPRNMLTTTITDELRLYTQKQAKVVGLSIKDRGAIFPAGHLGEAYWYDNTNGKFITSSYYRESAPEWVDQFNARNLADDYMNRVWEPLYDISTYTESAKDQGKYASPINGEIPVFPYDLSQWEDKYARLPGTPFGNDILLEMALATLDGEALGKGKYTDFLSVSFSSPDYIGHQFGPNAPEIEDTYIRLDKNIATLIKKLDEQVGKGNYVMFLTADHAVADVPQYLIDNNVPAGYFSEDLAVTLNEKLVAKFGSGLWIEKMSNAQIFLNRKLIMEKKKDLSAVQQYASELMLSYKGVAESFSAHTLLQADYGEAGIKGLLARGYNQQRSGDVLYSLEPGWFSSSENTGTTHGSAFTYDTHVPLLWYGAGIPKGSSVKYHPITDIAPTLSMMLEVKLPNGCTGQPIEELFE